MDKQRAGLDRCNMVEEALRETMRHTVPGSYIVANDRACCCSYESLQNLKQYKVVSVEQLKKFDTPGKSKLLNNLGNYSPLRSSPFRRHNRSHSSSCLSHSKRRFGKALSRSARRFKRLRTLWVNISSPDIYGDRSLVCPLLRRFSTCWIISRKNIDSLKVRHSEWNRPRARAVKDFSLQQFFSECKGANARYT